ncbi:MAG: 4Fe-4S dicluster domain-containing protein [Chloroflexi bacterium]|nr:4Fe-4S dicluster domain-containing protein [Chloroflexota bacterium]
MTDKSLTIGSTVALPKPELDLLMADLRKNGFQTVGPHLQDESIVYTKIDGLKDLPRGILSEQNPASYRMIQTGKDRYFDFIPGGQSWKQFLFPPRHTLFTAVKDGKWLLKENDEPTPRYALIGVRACELAAIHIQDRVFLREDFSDPIYRLRREGLFILAVNCLDPDATCFCVSMGTGPRLAAGFDLCVTELDEVFLVEVGSELGRSLLADRTYDLPSAFVQNTANQALERAAESMVRTMDTSDLPGLLTGQLEAERWTEVGKRCLSCANCTLVCPTCFCWDATDQVDILGKSTRRERVWDSCFNPQYSYVVGGNTRPNIRSRYRQWLTHKLGAWKSQFDVLGCVGCGRCITWCPAGIDLTEEVAAIRAEVKA